MITFIIKQKLKQIFNQQLSMINQSSSPTNRLNPIQPAVYRMTVPQGPAIYQSKTQLNYNEKDPYQTKKTMQYGVDQTNYVQRPLQSTTVQVYQSSPRKMDVQVRNASRLGQPSRIDSRISQNNLGQAEGNSISFRNNVSNLALGKKQEVILDNGDRYVGQVNKQGKFQGNGIYFYISEGYEYRGQFRNDRPHGKGKLYMINKQQMGPRQILIYDGEWLEGMRHGQGIYYYYTNKNYNDRSHFYEGRWNQNEKAEGVYNWSPEFNAKVVNNKLNGNGKYYFDQTKTQYIGNFRQNQFVDGNITYPNGDQYMGNLRNGQRNGPQGLYLYKNIGSKNGEIKYRGGWRNDLKQEDSSKATISYPNGDTLKGTFKNGEFINEAQCMYEWFDGTSFKGWLKQNNRGQIDLVGVCKRPNGEEFETGKIPSEGGKNR